MTVHGVSVSIKLMHTTLLDLGMTFKKNPSGRPSRTALMSPLPERNGMKANQR